MRATAARPVTGNCGSAVARATAPSERGPDFGLDPDDGLGPGRLVGDVDVSLVEGAVDPLATGRRGPPGHGAGHDDVAVADEAHLAAEILCR